MNNAKASNPTESTNAIDPLGVVGHPEPSETPDQPAPEAPT
ncbi:hypothetical protein [Marivivens donghaensis]|nr:hypothetical protein [Marivivens donghaensis]